MLCEQLPKFPRCWQLWWGTITKNWTQVAILVCDRHLCLLALCTPNRCFLWIFFYSPVGEVQQSADAHAKQPDLVLIGLAPCLFSSRVRTKKTGKNWKRTACMDSHTSFIACGRAHAAAAILLPHRRYGLIALDSNLYTYRACKLCVSWEAKIPWLDSLVHTSVNVLCC